MSVAFRDGAIHLAGACGESDAEALLLLLLDHPAAAVDWRACTAAHTAVLQVLLVARRDLVGPPPDPFLRTVVASALQRAADGLSSGAQ